MTPSLLNQPELRGSRRQLPCKFRNSVVALSELLPGGSKGRAQMHLGLCKRTLGRSVVTVESNHHVCDHRKRP